MHPSVTPLRVAGIPSAEIDKENSLGYELCRPAIWLGQVLGIISWDFIERSRNKTKSRSWKHALSVMYVLVAKIVLISILLFRIKNTSFITINYTPIVKAVYFSLYFIMIGLMFLIHIFFTLMVKRFNNLIRILITTDDLTGQRFKRQRILFNPMLLQFFISAAYLSMYIYFVVNISEDVKLDATYALLVFGHDLFVCSFFVITAKICAECFSTLNSELKEVVAIQTNVLSEYLDHIHHKYEQVYKLAEAVQMVFSVPVTGMLLRQAVEFGVWCYFVLIARSFSIECVLTLLSAVIALQRLFIICAEADHITTKARLALETLNNIHPRNLSATENFQVLILSNKLNQTPPEVTAVGNLFRVNMGTFTTIVGTILTYLIVLLQFAPETTKQHF